MSKQSKTLLLIPENASFMGKVLPYNFKDAESLVIPSTYTPFEREDLAKKINKDFNHVIFYDFYDQFYLLLPLINRKIKRSWILNISIAFMSEGYVFNNFLQIMEYQDRGLIDVLATTQYDFYVTLKDRVKYLMLDYEPKKNPPEQEERVGVLGIDYMINSNFYNQLSAIAISKINTAKVPNAMVETSKFPKTFHMQLEVEKDWEKLIYGNKVNLYCKMSDILPIPFIMSMDAGIPCVLGNTNLLNNSKLKEYLVLKSDDDVEEISQKINQVLDQKEEIMKLYSSWRKDYSKNAKVSIEEFLK